MSAEIQENNTCEEFRKFTSIASVSIFFDGQERDIYDVPITATYPSNDNEEEYERFEVDVIRAALKGASRDLRDLALISICYNIAQAHRDAQWGSAICFLCRNQGRYYFQPDKLNDTTRKIAAEFGCTINARSKHKGTKKWPWTQKNSNVSR